MNPPMVWQMIGAGPRSKSKRSFPWKPALETILETKSLSVSPAADGSGHRAERSVVPSFGPGWKTHHFAAYLAAYCVPSHSRTGCRLVLIRPRLTRLLLVAAGVGGDRCCGQDPYCAA